MSKTLDCRGLECPKPVIRCRELLEKESPETLTVLVDNLAAVENVRRFLGKSGYSVDTKQPKAQEWQLAAIKTGQGVSAQEGAASGQEGKLKPGAAKERDARILVLLTTETLGRGDEGLGARLMETFLATLPEIAPWRIVMLNGAVKLSAQPGAALESLKALAALGSEILVCGTCLNHYKLLEQKAVGETTNMVDVVTSLGLADKVIRP